VLAPTGWEERDAGLVGSLLVEADLVTSGHLGALVQVRVRRRLRPALAAGVLLVAGLAWIVQPPLAALVLATALVETARGVWRTGPAVRRAIARAAREVQP